MWNATQPDEIAFVVTGLTLLHPLEMSNNF